MTKFHDDELAALACMDGGCIIQPPQGQHTNGGCRCLEGIRDAHTRGKVFKALHRYRQIVSVLANAKLVKEGG